MYERERERERERESYYILQRYRSVLFVYPPPLPRVDALVG